MPSRVAHQPQGRKRVAAALLALPILALLLAAGSAWAAPSPTHLLDAGSTTDADSYTTGSFSITANCLVIGAISSAIGTGTANEPTLSGLTATWVSVNTATVNPRRLTVFRTMVGSNQTGTVAIDFGGQTQVRATWAFREWCDVDTSGTNGSGAVVQSATNTVALGTSLAVTLSAYSSSDNRPDAAFRVGADEDLTAESGWTELFDDTDGVGEASNHGGIWRDNTADTTPSMSWSSSVSAMGIAVEVKAADAGGAGSRGLLLGVW